MEAYTVEELRSIRDRRTHAPDELQKDITNLQEAIPHEAIVDQMAALSRRRDPLSLLKQPDFMLSTIDILFNRARYAYFNQEIIKRMEQERAHKNKEYRKQYRLDNKEEIKQKRKEYYENNKDKIKQYQESKRDYKQEKFNCDCGGRYTRQSKTHHYKSKKHQSYMNNPI